MKLFKNNEMKQALSVQQEINDIIDVMLQVGVLQAEKEILNMLGMDFGHCRRPFKKLDDNDKLLLKKVIDKLYI